MFVFFSSRLGVAGSIAASVIGTVVLFVLILGSLVLVENGEAGAPVRELTIASDLVSMLQAVRALGSDARWVPFGGSVKAPPILIAEMTVSGS